MTHTELHERQGWTLQQKIDHSLEVIETFVSRVGGLDKVYCSFSGGKDSTVLLDLCRIVYPDIKAVFFNTGNEYPDIVHFVKKLIGKGYNIDIVRPKYTPRQVWEQYGFPLISKEQSLALRQIKTTHSDKLRNYRLYGSEDGKRRAGTLSKKWRPLIEAPFMISEQCCQKLKKAPALKWVDGEPTFEPQYTIGELLSFLPQFMDFDDGRWALSIEADPFKVNGTWWVFYAPSSHTESVELIDAIFAMIVKLKEEGVI